MRLRVEGFGSPMSGYDWFVSGPVRQKKKDAAEDLRTLKAELNELKTRRAQLAEAQAEIERLKADAANQEAVKMIWFEDCMRTEQQLAASQATNKMLLGVFGEFLNAYDSEPGYERQCRLGLAVGVMRMYSIPPADDTTALNKLLAVVYEECAKVCEERGDYMSVGKHVAGAIRALAKQKGLTNG